MGKTKKIILYIVLPAVIAAAAWLGIVYYRTTVSYDGEIIAAVESEILIQRNASGVPLVRAGSAGDMYFAVGFLHGRDRLVLIEYFRAVARGRLSELTGKEGLEVDRIARTMGFTADADGLVKKLKSPYSHLLDSYVKGINTAKTKYMNEAKSFATVPSASWTASDVISILLLLEWADSFLNNRELAFPVPESLNNRFLADIIPAEYLYYYSLDESKDVDKLKKIGRIVKEYTGPGTGGLAFYLSGKRIKDGRPITGFNLNSTLDLYPKWYPVFIETGNQRLACVTSSGLPFIFYGSNGTMSFAGFSIGIDTQDFCVEKTKEINGETFYLRNGIWKKFETTAETIFTDIEHTEEGSVKITARRTDEGPVISGAFGGAEDTCVSVRMVVPDENYIVSLFDIPSAADPRSAAKLARNVVSAPRVYLFSDRDTATEAYSGMAPVRDISTGIFRNGSAANWRRMQDISGRAIVSGTKNIIIGDQYFDLPENIEQLAAFRDSNRYARLASLIENDRLDDRKETADVLLDSYSPVAEKFTPLFTMLLETVPITSSRLTRIYFNQWDFRLKPNSVPAAIFSVLLPNMIAVTTGDDLENYRDEYMENYDRIIDKFYLLMTEGKSFIFDDSGTKTDIEDMDAIFRRAFLKSLRHLNETYGPVMDRWRWSSGSAADYKIPLLEAGLFGEKQSGGARRAEKGIVNAAGGMGAINAMNIPGANMVTSLSGIIHGSELFLSPSFSCPMDPHSQYFKNYNKTKKFFCLNRQKPAHTLKIIPDGTKAGN